MVALPDHACDVIVTWMFEGTPRTEACYYVSDEFSIGFPLSDDPDLQVGFVLDCPKDKVFFEDGVGLFTLKKADILSVEEVH